jgi:hypothetical protein
MYYYDADKQNKINIFEDQTKTVEISIYEFSFNPLQTDFSKKRVPEGLSAHAVAINATAHL